MKSSIWRNDLEFCTEKPGSEQEREAVGIPRKPDTLREIPAGQRVSSEVVKH